jgi:hypothetical protein
MYVMGLSSDRVMAITTGSAPRHISLVVAAVVAMASFAAMVTADQVCIMGTSPPPTLYSMKDLSPLINNSDTNVYGHKFGAIML